MVDRPLRDAEKRFLRAIIAEAYSMGQMHEAQRNSGLTHLDRCARHSEKPSLLAKYEAMERNYVETKGEQLCAVVSGQVPILTPVEETQSGKDRQFKS